MHFENFSIGTSRLHNLDVRLKLIAALSLSSVIALCQNLTAPLTALGVAIALVFTARLPLLSLSRRMLMVNGFMLFFWLTLPLTVPGDQLMTMGPFIITDNGVQLATLVTLKSNAIILVFIALVATSRVAEIGHGLAAIKIPQRFCMLLLFTYRYIFVLNQEYNRLRRAALLRGFRPSTTMHTYQTYANLLGMTLVKSWQRGMRVQQAMLLRGFQGRFYLMTGSALRAADWFLFSLVMVATLAVALIELSYRTF